MDLNGKTILVTGGAGFLGSALVKELRGRSPKKVFVPRSADYDLREPEQVRRLLSDVKPDLVIHLAATVGGIGANRDNPGKFFYENAVMGIHLIEECRRAGVEKTVVIGTICSYPKITPVPFAEDDLWSGYPEETNAPYGLAKKMLMVQGQAYRQQYGMNVIHVMPANLYGPGDNFDPDSSHVIPALIKKMIEARDSDADEVEVWGTGNPTREFLYVDDAALGIALAAERYDSPEPLNLGTGSEVSIRDLATLITELCGFKGKLVFDASKPDGQPRRVLDTSRAAGELGFEASVDLRSGLKATVDWWQKHGSDEAASSSAASSS